MDAWKGFCAFCAKALPSMSTFLKLSVPILATLISSTIDSPSFECVTAASALHPCIEQFKTMSIELLGDTGAAHDIGSLEALQEQGAPVDTVKPWIRCQDSPIIDLPSHEALELYARSVGELQLHLLKRCPLAMSIGKQVSSGRTFIGDTGENRIWSQITESVRYGFP